MKLFLANILHQSSIAALFLILTNLAPIAQAAMVYYVATNESDRNAGTIDKPLKNIQIIEFTIS